MSFDYGETDYREKEKVWDRLMRLRVHRRECWSLVGDLNKIHHNGEKLGGPNRNKASVKGFRDCLNTREMTELCGVGDIFTWTVTRCQKYIQSKSDCCFGNKQWQCTFPRVFTGFGVVV